MNQKTIIRLVILFAVIVMVVGGYIILRTLLNPAKPADKPTAGILPPSTTVELTVQVDSSTPYNTLGQIIQYSYTIKNIGAAPIPGMVSISGAVAACPNVNTTGNLDNFLDANEPLTCTSNYAIAQADLDAGSVTSVTAANVNNTLSPQVTTKVTLVQNRLLTLTKTAAPQTFDQVGQTITYTYIITNGGNVTLGPAQFIVSDTGLDGPYNCGDPNTTLAPTQTLTCSATHVITQADLDAASVTTSATVSGGGSQASIPVTVTITKSDKAAANPSNLTQGTTIQHKVAAGEWLWQIARCYGADPKQVVQANSQLADADQISPDTTVTVPNIGSKGAIYGPVCTATHTVQAGDTWNSIAQKYSASTDVLQRVNPGRLSVGRVVIIPLHSGN